MANKFGLSRNIPLPVKREVRRRSGFCCIVCGNIFCDYHHFEEEYANLERHDPSKIVLLCGTCHTDVTGGKSGRRISDETLRGYAVNPYGKRRGENHWYNRTSIKGIKLGKFLFLETKIAVRIEGFELLSFSIADGEFPIIVINAHFFNRRGEEILTIEENTVHGNTDVWDFEGESNKIQINFDRGDISLRIIFHNDGIIEIDRMRLLYGEYTIEVTPDGKVICSTDKRNHFLADEARILGADVGIDIKSGFIEFGKCERITYGKGKSRIDTAGTGRFRRSRVSSNPSYSHSSWVNYPHARPTVFSFEGNINGSQIKMSNNLFGPGVTPLRVKGDSIFVGSFGNDVD